MADDPKATLQRYLGIARDTLLWKLDGVSEYDARRPMTATATNLLGIVKHMAIVVAGYFGAVFERPFPDAPPWFEEDGPNIDMWATAEESREGVVALYRRAWAHADATVAALPLDAPGNVPWWGEANNPVTLHRILVHVLAEANRHNGHADILREQVDGAAGMRPGVSNLPERDVAWWAAYRQRVEDAAQAAARAGEAAGR
jgi:uncharacterized damage-inducible protein DinB